MEIEKKGCLINAAWKGWYPKGSNRLRRSLIEFGWSHDLFTWQNERINEYFKEDYPYTIKMAALVEAVRMGYTHIIWMDCSVWPRRNCDYLMNRLDAEGGLFFLSGFNLAQTSGDNDLLWAGYDRDQAEKMDEIWSCVFGINLETETGKKFFKILEDAYHHNVFNTPRAHSGLSSDSRFLHARQDQTAVSLAYYKSGYNIVRHIGNDLLYWDGKQDPKDHTLLMQGM